MLMKLNITYRHLDPTPAIKAKITEKATHLKKFFHGKIEISWVCSIENKIHRSSVNVHASHNYFHAEAKSDNLYKTFDEVIEKLERQIMKKDSKAKDKIHLPKTELIFEELEPSPELDASSYY